MYIQFLLSWSCFFKSCVYVLAVRRRALLGVSVIEGSQPKDPKLKIRGRILRNGVSWQGGVKEKEKKKVKQGSQTKKIKGLKLRSGGGWQGALRQKRRKTRAIDQYYRA